VRRTRRLYSGALQLLGESRRSVLWPRFPLSVVVTRGRSYRPSHKLKRPPLLWRPGRDRGHAARSYTIPHLRH